MSCRGAWGPPRFRLPRMRPTRRSGRLGLAIAALLFSVAVLTEGATATASATHGAASRDTCTTSKGAATGNSAPLEGICEYLDGREGIVQVALFDKKAGRSYRLSNGDDTQFTASIVKVDILAKWLRYYQKRGAEIPADVPYSIKYLMHRMIENSDNAAATSLFHFGGGCDALTRFNKLIPLDETKVGCESQTYYGWGNTTTTASDQVDLMKLFAYGRPKRILGLDARNFGEGLMESVQPDQRFGISCGPWGTACSPPNYAEPDPDVSVALKNGWKTLPTCTKPIDQCPWQVNSTGWVKGHGRNYAIAVLTTRDPVGTGDLYGYNYGIDTIQNVSARVWDNLN
jgi:hypothetical protein